MEAIKIRSIEIRKIQKGSFAIRIPIFIFQEMGLEEGDYIGMYRGEAKDELILKAEKHFLNQENSEIQENEDFPNQEIEGE